MQIEFMWKTDDQDSSWNGNSPAIYRVKGGKGGYVLQGHKLDEETAAQLRNVALNEAGIWVPDDVIDRLRQQ